MSDERKPVRPPPLRRRFAAARRTVLRTLATVPEKTDPLARLAERLGLPVRLLGVEAPRDISGDGQWCVHLRDAAGRPLVLRADDAVIGAASAGALGTDPWTLPVDDGGEVIAGVLTAQALRCLEALASGGWPLELQDVHRASIERPVATGCERLSLRLLVGDTVGRVEVDVAPESDERPSGPRPAWLESVPVGLAAVVARGRVARGALRTLAIGDAVTFDEVADGEDSAAVWLEPIGAAAGGPRWTGRLASEGELEITALPGGAGWRRAMVATDGDADRTEVTPMWGGGLDDVPIDVSAVVGRATRTVAELGALGPGSVVPLGRSPGGVVDLLAGGVVFARGRLVDLDGELAVEVSELRAVPPPA